jgi:hypothetical protein
VAAAVGVDPLSPQPENVIPDKMTQRESTIQRMATTFPTSISGLSSQCRLLHVRPRLSRKVRAAAGLIFQIFTVYGH